MAKEKDSSSPSPALTVARHFNFTAEQVFDAWLDPQSTGKWLYATPTGKMVRVEIDARVGGRYALVDRRNGEDVEHVGEYLEIDRPRRLVFTLAVPKYSTVYTTVTIEIAPQGAGCQLTLTHHGVLPEWKDATQSGWTGILSALAEFVSKEELDEPAFMITREFDAPRELVWKAWTESDRLARWWGPKGFEMLQCKVDLRPGGLCHYGMRAPNGMEMWGKFVYRQVIPPEQLVFINSFSDKDGGTTRHFASPTWPLEVLNVMTLTEHDGRTTVTLKGRPINATEEERKTFASGFTSMQKGFGGTLDQLDEYLLSAE